MSQIPVGEPAAGKGLGTIPTYPQTYQRLSLDIWYILNYPASRSPPTSLDLDFFFSLDLDFANPEGWGVADPGGVVGGSVFASVP